MKLHYGYAKDRMYVYKWLKANDLWHPPKHNYKHSNFVHNSRRKKYRYYRKVDIFRYVGVYT